MEDLLSWDVPFDHLEAPQGLASRVEAVEKEGVRAWRVLFFQRPSDGAKEGPAVLGARVLPEPPGLPPLTLEGSTLAFAGWRLALLGLPHGLLLPAYRPLLDGAPYPALGLTFPLGGARCYGLGERARGLERRGGRYWNLTADRFPQPGQDPLYQAHPLFLCLRGARALGLLLDESAPSLFDLGFSHPGEGRVLALAPRLDLYLLEGEVLEVVRGLTLLTGRPLMPPLWALGYHQSRYSYMHEEALKEVFRRFQEEDLPLESLWRDIHDGQEEGVWREVRGAFDGKRLHLFLEEPREGVMAEVLGMPRPLRVRGGVWREGRLLLDLGKGEAWARSA